MVGVVEASLAFIRLFGGVAWVVSYYQALSYCGGRSELKSHLVRCIALS